MHRFVHYEREYSSNIYSQREQLPKQLPRTQENRIKSSPFASVLCRFISPSMRHTITKKIGYAARISAVNRLRLTEFSSTASTKPLLCPSLVCGIVKGNILVRG
ncbi:hypothetical protein CEXT_116431 [Caerostris extrusa]|uniref:Uncharacterized protein n=1 Tax=Caerostris extrusa TaxID=172846 RepID=A0AAV4VDC2_CAEEX|nr:hypothetical protein CEXT_116431 [Caerostris extrusa]